MHRIITTSVSAAAGKLGPSKVGLGKLSLGKLGFGKVGRRFCAGRKTRSKP